MAEVRLRFDTHACSKIENIAVAVEERDRITAESKKSENLKNWKPSEFNTLKTLLFLTEETHSTILFTKND